MLRRSTASAATLALLAISCAAAPAAAHLGVEIGKSSAHRPSAPPAPSGDPAAAQPSLAGYELLAGDMHCHVRPLDGPGEAPFDVAETVARARREGLDFVVLTPHVRSRFYTSSAGRHAALADRAALRSALARESAGKTIFVLGMEYTDPRHGHVGAAFADLEQVLADVPMEVAARRPERFFESFVARGGVLVYNHPLVSPLDASAIARDGGSFRPFVASGPFPPEIRALDRLGQGIEAFNLTVTKARDRVLLGSATRTLEATLAFADRASPLRKRRLTPVGGSDAEELRATTFVLGRGRTEAAIRDAILAGRVCVRSADACSLEVRPEGGAWATVGTSLHGVSAVEVRARGEEIDLFVDGRFLDSPPSGEAVRIPVDATRCTVIRARVGEGYSAPVYANCPF